jgi:hypothetical protein
LAHRRRPTPLKKTLRRWDDSETARRATSRLDSVVRQLFAEEKHRVADAIAGAYE